MRDEAEREYTTMAATRYQHSNQESEADHHYFYDCVAFASYAMSRAAPTAWASTRDTLAIGPGRVPSPAKYVSLFDKVDAGANLAGWAPVGSVAMLQPGDVVAWSYDRASTTPHGASGHAVVIAATPTPTGPGAYSVLVYDSTGTPTGRATRAAPTSPTSQTPRADRQGSARGRSASSRHRTGTSRRCSGRPVAVRSGPPSTGWPDP